MKWAFLGSSNTFNHKNIFLMEGKSVRNDRKMQKCTSIMNFKLEVESLDKSFELLTIAGLDIALNDLKTSGTDVNRYVRAGLTELFEVINNKAKEGVKTTIGPLVYWSSFDDKFKKLITDEMLLVKAKYPSIYFIPPIANLRLSKDGVHLDQKSAEKYLGDVIELSLKKWLTPIDEDLLEQEPDVNVSQETINIDTELSQTGIKRKRGRVSISTGRGKSRYDDELLDSMYRRLDHLEFNHNKTLLFIAKHEEALDTARNEKNMNKVIFSGVEIENLSGTMEVKKPIILEALKAVMSLFMEADQIPEVKYVVHLNERMKTKFRVIEARFETPKDAKTVRGAFGAKIKDWKVTKLFPDALKGVGINLCHTRETRIRIEVLKALAKVVNKNTNNDMEAYVLPFLARPLLKLNHTRADGNKHIRSCGYTEAVTTVTGMFDITDQELHQAYKIAGSMPDLEQKFLILRTGFNSVKGWKGQGTQGPGSEETDEPEDKRIKTSANV